MAYSDSQWQVVRAFYERGLSLSEIVERDEVEIKSRSQISKRAARESWEKSPEKKQLVEREVKLKQEVVFVAEKKETLKETDRRVHDALVDERTKDLIFIRKASLIVAQKAVDKVQEEDCTMQDLRHAQEVIGKGKENIYGKSPDTAVQINNTNQTAAPNRIEMVIVDHNPGKDSAGI